MNESEGSGENPPTLRPEAEHDGPIWTHPYAIYVWLTCILFAVILVAGYLAWTNDWLPRR